ncbi:mechanosensitive ion channel family protein [candidate division KSB1 bacterium]|nr:mechanosensitive ion channel family protein [candidate division KSB1 bacterium]
MQEIFEALKQSESLTSVVLSTLILIGTYLVSRLAVFAEKIVARHTVQRTETLYDDKLFDIVDRAIRRLIWIVGFYLAFRQLHIFWANSTMIPSAIKGVLYVIAVLILARMLNRILETLLEWYTEEVGERSSVQLKEEFRPLLRRMIGIVIYLMAVVHIMHYFKQNISSVLVSLGVGSLAIALAAKDTLANMIAGFMIMTDRPFRLGDRILLESGEMGDVYDIGLRTTKILTFDNTLIVVPNQQIINEKLTNLSYPDPQIRVVVHVGVAYGSNLEQVKQIMEQACLDHPDVLETSPPEAYFLNFGDSSLDLRVVCRVATWGQQWRVSEDIRLTVYKAFQEAGIEIPFPQRVVTVQKNPDEPSPEL